MSAILNLRTSMAILISGVAAFAADGATWYVRHDAASPGDGLSWSTAFADLDVCLAGLPPGGQRINVAGGTYQPRYQIDDVVPEGTPGGTQPSFRIRAGVRIFGGYAGEATAGSESGLRDPQTYPTILSGEIEYPSGEFPACSESSNGCLTSSETPGCEDVACCGVVCGVDPTCCELAWTEACATRPSGLCYTGRS